MVSKSQVLWFAEKEWEARARGLVNRCKRAQQDNLSRQADAYVFAQLVDNDNGLWSNSQIAGRSDYFSALQHPMYRNTARSIYETVIAKVASLSEDLPQLMATNADYTRQQAAQDITRWLEVLYYQPHGTYSTIGQLTAQGFGISLITGTVLAFPEMTAGGNIELHLDDSLTVGFDRSDLHSRPMAMVRTRRYLREELMCLVKTRSLKEAVKKAKVETVGSFYSLETKCDHEVVPVYQGWVLNQGDKTGYFIFCLEDGTILDKGDYDSCELPCASFNWYRSLNDQFGVPLLRVIIDACVQENMSLADYVDAASDSAHTIIETEDPDVLNQLPQMNKLSGIQRKAGSAALTIRTPPDNPTWANLADRLRTAAFETAGVNEAAASSKRLGGNSGIQDHYIATLTSERYARQSREFTQFRAVDIAKALIRFGVMFKDRNPDAKFSWRKGQKEKDLLISDLDLEGADKFTLDIAAVDEERHSPRARLQKAEQMMEAGELDPVKYFEMTEHFDVQGFTNDEYAVLDWVDEQIEDWSSIKEEDLGRVTGEVVQYPSPFIGKKLLKACLKKVALAHTSARARGASPARLELFETFLNVVAGQVKQAEAFEAPPPPQQTPNQ